MALEVEGEAGESKERGLKLFAFFSFCFELQLFLLIFVK